MPRILVTPLSGLDDAIGSHRPSHLVTLLSPEHMIETPAGFRPHGICRLGVNDVADPAAGEHPPGARPCRPAAGLSAGTGTPGAAADPLLGRHQPLHGVGLHRAVRPAGPGPGSRDRAGDAPPRAPCQSQSASGAPCRRGAGARRPHGRRRLKRWGQPLHGGGRRHHRVSAGATVSTDAISIGLSAAIVSVEQRTAFGAGGGARRQRGRAALRSLRSGTPAHPGTGLAQMGGRADPLRSRLYRTALHLRRSRPASAARAGERGARVVSVGYLALTRPGRDAPARAIRAGATGISIFPGRIGATQSRAMIDGVILPA